MFYEQGSCISCVSAPFCVTAVEGGKLVRGRAGRVFICPADVIPDAIPAIGFVDDAAALAAVFKILKKYVTTESGNATKRKLARIFRNADEEEQARIVESLTRKGEKG